MQSITAFWLTTYVMLMYLVDINTLLNLVRSFDENGEVVCYRCLTLPCCLICSARALQPLGVYLPLLDPSSYPPMMKTWSLPATFLHHRQICSPVSLRPS